VRYRRRKVDANQAEIVAALRAAGCSVVDLSAVGDGCPDLLVGRGFQNFLLEVKQPGEKIRKDKRGELQRRFHDEWRGQRSVVSTVNGALAAVLACEDLANREVDLA